MTKKYRCGVCVEYFETRKEYISHCRRHKPKRSFRCKFCRNLQFKQKRELEIHYLSHRCYNCGGDFLSLKVHLTKCNPPAQVGEGIDENFSTHPFVEISAFKGFLKTFRHRAEDEFPTPESYYSEFETLIKTIIKNGFVKKKAAKVQFVLLVEFIREIFDENNKVVEETLSHYVNSDLVIVLNSNGVKEAFKKIQAQIQFQIELFERNGSGWQLNKIEGSDIKLAAFDVHLGGCNVDLPEKIACKRAIINPQLKSNKCFVEAFIIGAHFSEVKAHRERPTKYRKFKKLYNWKGVEFPTPLTYVKKFEKLNNVAINVFTYTEDEKEDCINIIYRSPFCTDASRKIVNLYYQPSDKTFGHWLAITSVSR